MENLRRSDQFKRAFQRPIPERLRAENFTLEQLDRNEKTIPTASPQLNGALKANQRNSGSDDEHNYPSSSSQEVESPDSQRVNQRSIGRQSNRQPLVRDLSRESSSLSQLETQNHNSVEFNDNLSIDPQEVTPINKVQESPEKDRFCASLKEQMFTACKRKEPVVEENMFILRNICENLLKLPSKYQPDYLKHYFEGKLRSPGPNSRNSGNCTRSINGKTEKNKDSHKYTNTLHNSCNLPSTSQQGARESEYIRRKGKLLKAMAFVDKELKNEQPPFHDVKNLPSRSQAAEESSRNCSRINDRKRQHMESYHSFINSREVKLEQQPIQDSKALSSVSQLGGVESARTCSVPKHYRKRKNDESSRSVITANEQEGQRLSLDSKSKHVLRTKYVTKGKETAQSAAKAYEFKDECQMPQGGKVKLDPKRVCVMSHEAKHCDKIHIKKIDSDDQSAMLAVTSSKKERTSLYHGGRNAEISTLRNMSVQVLIKALKKNSDPTKLIYKAVDFEIIEPVLVLVSPDKLQKIDDYLPHLQQDTNKIWLWFCEREFKSQLRLKKEQESWRTFYFRCDAENKEKLQNVTASVSASQSKAKPDRQIKLTTVNGPPTKRPKIENAMVAKNRTNAGIKPLPNFFQPSTSRSDVPVPPKEFSHHIKSGYKTIKKDAPLMHKAKKTMGHLHRIHRN